jgi:hypothetical protein
MITCASGSASTSGQPTICSAHPQSQTRVSSSCRVAVSPASSSAQAGSEQTSVAVYMTGQSVGARSDGTQDGYHRTVLPVAVTSAVAWFFPAGFLLIGGGMIALAVKAKRRRARWEAADTSTSGEVTDLRWQSVGQAGDSNLLAFPVLRFSLPDGRTVETQSSWGTNPPAAKPGAQVTVLYDPADPTSASLPAGGSSAVVSGVIIGLGGILVAVGLAAAAFLGVVGARSSASATRARTSSSSS